MKKAMLPTLVIAMASIAAGCASSGSPVSQAQLTETEATIRSAESAGAFERAPDLLQKARQALSSAQQASGRGDHAIAREHLDETTAYAEAARARAEAEGKKKELSMVRQQADELDVKVRQFQKQLQTP